MLLCNILKHAACKADRKAPYLRHHLLQQKSHQGYTIMPTELR